MSETASCDKGVIAGLSRVRGNLHARFLGEEAAAMSASLPDRAARKDKKTRQRRTRES